MSGGSKKVTIGYKIYLGLQFIWCRGPIDYVRRIRVDEKNIFEGFATEETLTIDEEELFGGKKQEGGISGDLDIEFGLPTQVPNAYLQSKIQSNIPAYRGVVNFVLNQMYLGTQPYIKKWDARLQRIHQRQDGVDQWYDEKAPIGAVFDPNTLYYTRYEGNNTNLAQYTDIVPQELGSDSDPHNYINSDGGYYEINTDLNTDDYNKIDVSDHLTMGDDFVIEALIQWQSSGAFSLLPFMAYRVSGSNAHEWGWSGYFGDTGYVSFDTDVGGDQYHSGAAGHGKASGNVEHFAIQFEFVSGTTYRTRAYWKGVQRYTESLSHLNNSSFGADFRIGTYGPNGTQQFKIYEVAIRKENKYPDGTTFTPPTALDPADTGTGVLDMNPIHIIRECLTDPDWGMGYPEEDIDDGAFMAAADQCYAEQFGLSLIWDRQKPIEDFIKDILEHIDAVLYVSKSTGKFVVKLIRDDYNETGLTILDEDSVVTVEDYSQVSFGELVNSVSVVYYNRSISKPDSITVQDIALYQQQGTSIETTRQYPGITKQALATRVAERDLKVLSTPLISCTVLANRTAANINIGDAFILDWPDYEINSVIMRAQEISYGDGRTNRIKIKCVQDVFALPDTAAVAEVTETSPTLVENAQNASPRLTLEAPYYMLVQNLSEADANSILSNNALAGYLVGAGGRPTTNHLNGDLWVDPGTGTYEDAGTFDFCPWGTLVAESDSYLLDKTTTLILLDNGADLDDVTTPTFCQIGDEIMRVDSLVINSDSRYEMTAGRGCLDTVPQEHTNDSSGQYAFFYEDLNGFFNTEFNENETANSKILTTTLTDQLLLSEATAETLTFRKRAILPYPPGNFKIEGQYYPDSVVPDSADNIVVTWSHRDRTQQTSSTIYDHTEGDIGPEAGTTYTLRLYDESGALDTETTGISGTSANVNLSGVITSASSTATIKVWSVRGGYESWQPVSHTFTF